MRNVLLLLLGFLCLYAFAPTNQAILSQSDIQQKVKVTLSLAPEGYKAIQTDCVFPNDKDDQTVAHGAICAPGPNRYCVENECPEGTIHKRSILLDSLKEAQKNRHQSTKKQ